MFSPIWNKFVEVCLYLIQRIECQIQEKGRKGEGHDSTEKESYRAVIV
jgi:hypothetical protein